jgi:hypothetical protein
MISGGGSFTGAGAAPGAAACAAISQRATACAACARAHVLTRTAPAPRRPAARVAGVSAVGNGRSFTARQSASSTGALVTGLTEKLNQRRLEAAMHDAEGGDLRDLQLTAQIGEGGFARVFRGLWRGQVVAVKVRRAARPRPRMAGAHGGCSWRRRAHGSACFWAVRQPAGPMRAARAAARASPLPPPTAAPNRRPPPDRGVRRARQRAQRDEERPRDRNPQRPQPPQHPAGACWGCAGGCVWRRGRAARRPRAWLARVACVPRMRPASALPGRLTGVRRPAHETNPFNPVRRTRA